jgi:hypothetical protein
MMGKSLSQNDDNNQLEKGTLFVITAYTLEECDDDAEVVAELAGNFASDQSGTVARELWAPEHNPFSSRMERKTKTAAPDRQYFENGAWQAWILGL